MEHSEIPPVADIILGYLKRTQLHCNTRNQIIEAARMKPGSRSHKYLERMTESPRDGFLDNLDELLEKTGNLDPRIQNQLDEMEKERKESTAKFLKWLDI